MGWLNYLTIAEQKAPGKVPRQLCLDALLGRPGAGGSARSQPPPPAPVPCSPPTQARPDPVLQARTAPSPKREEPVRVDVAPRKRPPAQPPCSQQEDQARPVPASDMMRLEPSPAQGEPQCSPATPLDSTEDQARPMPASILIRPGPLPARGELNSSPATPPSST